MIDFITNFTFVIFSGRISKTTRIRINSTATVVKEFGK